MSHTDIYGTKQAFKLVDEALQSDSNNENEVAYAKYLESVSTIAMTLLTNKNTGLSNRFTRQQRQKLIDTAHQCLERVSSLSQLLDEQASLVDIRDSNFCPPTTAAAAPVSLISDKIMSESGVDHPSLILDMPTSLDPKPDDSKCKCLSVLETIDWVSTEDPLDRQTLSQQVSPLEKAKKLNESLMVTYEKRMARCTQTNIRINIALELHRRMAENLKIAREQEKLYLQSMQEQRRLRFQEAVRKISLFGFRHSTNGGLQSTTDLIVEIMQYGEKKKWVEDLKKRLGDDPNDGNLVELVIRTTLRDSEHPITKWLIRKTESLCNRIKILTTESPNLKLTANQTENSSAVINNTCDKHKSNLKHATDSKKDDTKEYTSFQDSYDSNKAEIEVAMDLGESLMSQLKEATSRQKSLAKASVKFVKRLRNDKNTIDDHLQPEESVVICNCKAATEATSSQDELDKITSEINHTLNELVELFVLTYDQVGHECNRERCSVTLEMIFFPDVWPLLSSLCKVVYQDDITSVARSMDQMVNVTPAELDFNLEDSSPASEKDYQKIIQLLCHMTQLKVPNEKLKVLVHVVKIMCDGYQKSKDVNKTRNMGADDLIPLLSYICIRSRLASLMSECQLLERLINPRYLMGEEGYCLTSLQTAIKYIQSCERKVDDVPIETTV